MKDIIKKRKSCKYPYDKMKPKTTVLIENTDNIDVQVLRNNVYTSLRNYKKYHNLQWITSVGTHQNDVYVRRHK